MPQWTGYTIGYYGRPFETKKLQALDGNDEEAALPPQKRDEQRDDCSTHPPPPQQFLRFVVGSGSVIPALDEGVSSMAEGGVRQLVVPPEIGPAASCKWLILHFMRAHRPHHSRRSRRVAS